MRYIATPSGLVPAHLYARPIRQRSDLASPMLLRDGMDALRNPANGLLYESKSAFRRATKAAGAEEVGTDRLSPTKSVDTTVTNDVGRAIQMVKAGYQPKIAGTTTEGWGDAG